MISLLRSVKNCKVDTAWANRYQSDRFENPDNMSCPIWLGRDSVGRPASENTYVTKSAGCNSPADRVYVENTLRPQYMEATTTDSYGFRSDLYQDPHVGNITNLSTPVGMGAWRDNQVQPPGCYQHCPFYPYDWNDPTLSNVAVYSRKAQNIQHQTKAYDMMRNSGFA